MKRKSLLLSLMLCLAFLGVAKAQQRLPYSYGFEDNNLATDGWTVNVTSTNSGINNAAAHTGSYGFRFNYSEQSGYLVSPLLSGGDKGITVSFYYKEYSSSYGDEQFYVGYTTDENATDPERFTYGEIVTASTSWQAYETTLPEGTQRVAIKYVYNDAFYLYLDDFSFEVPSACAKPTNLAVNYEGGTTATVTWEGEARSYNIDVNGTVTNGVSSPYTLRDLEYATDYTVMVQADCGDEQSGWVSQSFRTDCDVTPLPFFCGFEDESEYGCLSLANTANGTGLTNTADYVHEGSFAFAFSYNSNPPQYLFFPGFEGTSAISMTFFYKVRSANYPETFQVGYSTTTQTISAFTWLDEVSATNASDWLEHEEVLPNGTKYVAIRYNSNDMFSLYLDDFNFVVATGCLKPSGLAANDITTSSATLSWAGDNDSYVLQYRPWNPAGDDIITTGTMTTYTVDLSEYTGTGSVAIRHYDITDMFALVVDDIQVTNAANEVVYSQDFESCGGNMPSEFTNMDLDGDGYTWSIATSANVNVNGSYGLYSSSYDNNVGALTPDNWLIVSGIEMGGQMTFQARGQDESYAAENFAIYVSTENSIVEVPVTATTYNASDLTPNTPYSWQVKGLCGDEETRYVSSFFKTLDDKLVFATAGNWNDIANWKDAQGNAVTALPTADNNVSIEAAATVPAGVVAQANKVTINGGSITIKDGGQLKQNSATLRVTMEKEITGYGESDGNYYFISSPFNGRTLYETSGSFSHVENMFTGEYDLYAFDAAASDGLEWINYESSPTHISFQAENGLEGLLYGEGYLYANQEGATLAFEGTTGKSNNYSETKDYTFDASSTDSFNGWRLVGNFFTCDAYINYIDAEGNVLDADFYTMNAAGDGYDLSSSNVGLAPLTGAFINYNATGKVQYSTETPAKHSGVLNMSLTQGRANVDQARIRFGEGYNLDKVSFRNNGSTLYMTQGDKNYAVVATESNLGEMPVNFKANANGVYTLSFSNDNVEFSYLHLIDNLTGNDVDLLANPSYSFEATSTDYASRFKLVYSTSNSTLGNEFGFVSNGNLKIFGLDGQATLKVMDITGRTLSTENFSGSYDKQLNLSAGVYMIQLIQGNDVKTQKIVIK